ncbi:MAG: hypothetical protein KDJ40_00180 [Hyphomicrobiales bacterium]|nr:hypothetical protein [Hyphomicrobiales bacterium]
MAALSSFLTRSGRVAGRGAKEAEKIEEHAPAGFLSRARRSAESAVGVGGDVASGLLGGGAGLGRLGRIGVGIGALGVAAAEMEEIIRLVKFVGEFVHDPKGALTHLFGGQTEGDKQHAIQAAKAATGGAPNKAAAMLSSLAPGGGAKVDMPSFDATRVAIHEPGRAKEHGARAAMQMGPHGGPRTIEEAYLRSVEMAEKNGQPIKPGSIVEMEFVQNGRKSHVNVEAVDGKSFLPIAGENGRSQLILPRGFETADYAKEAGKRLEAASGIAIDARAGVPGREGGFATIGPALMASGRADGQSAEAIKLAGMGMGIGGIGATQEVAGRRIGAPDDSVAMFASRGTADGGRALRYEGALIDGGRASLVLSTSGQGEAQKTVMSAKSERPGLNRMAVVTGSSTGLGGVGADGKIALSREGRESVHALGEAAGRKIDVLLAGTEKMGAKRDSAVVIDRDSGRAVESVWSGNRMVTVSDGRIDLVTKGADGKLSVKSIEDREVSVNAKTGTTRLSTAALTAVSEFSRAPASGGAAIEAKDFMASLPVRAPRSGGVGVGD